MAEKEPKKTDEKIVVTPALRKIWLRIRSSWNTGFDSFSNILSALNEKEAGQLYEVVRHSVFKGSYVDILREHPELKEIVKSDDDRLCMHDIYEVLSWRLGKTENVPKDREIEINMKSRIGRKFPVFRKY